MSTDYLDALAPQRPATETAASSATTATRALLTCGLVAGPLYVFLVVIQMGIRDGFDIRRHAASLLTNGDLGWIQVANFLVAGLLTVAGAVGMRRALRGERGGTWGPVLLGIYGVSLIGASIFHADPALGFPPGTPADASAISWHGLLHFICGGIGFPGFIAACLVFARRFAARGERGWAAYSAATGILFLAAFVGIASGSKGPTAPAFAIAVALGWAWVTAQAWRLLAALR